MAITVRKFVDLLLDGNIMVYLYNMTFQFEVYSIPEELLDMEIDFIDNPEVTTRPQPLCINLSTDDMSAEDFKRFSHYNVNDLVYDHEREMVKAEIEDEETAHKNYALGYRRPTPEEEDQLLQDGHNSVDAHRGYTISQFGRTGMLKVTTLMPNVFGDGVASQQAKREGIKLIPAEELPWSFNMRYEGWIDIPENREAIDRYCLERKIDNVRINKALEILKDNGIEEDECITVLQAIGYALLDIELFH